MAKVEGFKCDICNTYAEGHKPNGGPADKPLGWFVLILPKTGVDNVEDRNRDVCSAKCLITFGRERHAAEKGAPNRPASSNDRLPREITDEYDRLGLSQNERIAIGQNHRMHVRNGLPQDDCLRCQYEAEHRQAAS